MGVNPTIEERIATETKLRNELEKTKQELEVMKRGIPNEGDGVGEDQPARGVRGGRTRAREGTRSRKDGQTKANDGKRKEANEKSARKGDRERAGAGESGESGGADDSKAGADE